MWRIDAVVTGGHAMNDTNVRGPAWLGEGAAAYYGLILTYGILTFGLGIVIAVWPDETLVVVAVLIAIQLLIAGVLRIVLAIAPGPQEAGVRVLTGLMGALALVVGLLCLRDPLQTLVVITLLLGGWWVVSGVFDIVQAIMPRTTDRAWEVVTGVVSILGGGFLLANPDISLDLLVWVLAAWLLLTGAVAVVAAMRLRAVDRAAATPQML